MELQEAGGDDRPIYPFTFNQREQFARKYIDVDCYVTLDVDMEVLQTLHIVCISGARNDVRYVRVHTPQCYV